MLESGLEEEGRTLHPAATESRDLPLKEAKLEKCRSRRVARLPFVDDAAAAHLGEPRDQLLERVRLTRLS